MKTKITTCGNCVYLCKTYNRYNPIKWKCAIRWWTYRPNNENRQFDNCYVYLQRHTTDTFD